MFTRYYIHMGMWYHPFNMRIVIKYNEIQNDKTNTLLCIIVEGVGQHQFHFIQPPPHFIKFLLDYFNPTQKSSQLILFYAYQGVFTIFSAYKYGYINYILYAKTTMCHQNSLFRCTPDTTVHFRRELDVNFGVLLYWIYVCTIKQRKINNKKQDIVLKEGKQYHLRSSIYFDKRVKKKFPTYCWKYRGTIYGIVTGKLTAIKTLKLGSEDS